jgi:hypothetical protein
MLNRGGRRGRRIDLDAREVVEGVPTAPEQADDPAEATMERGK